VSRLDRALDFERGSVELVADQISEIEEGWVARSAALPGVWSANLVRLRRPVAYERALELTERHMGDAAFRQLFVEEAAGGERLAESFRADGWEVDVEVHMALAGDAVGEADVSRVVEAGEDETLDLMDRWLREDETMHLTAEGLRQMRRFHRGFWRGRRARRFGVRDRGGALAAMTLLLSDGSTAQVEDVYVTPEQRGRGQGRALVGHAVAEARRLGHEFTFIVADDNDWPKQLYAACGFQPVGRTWLFHLDLERAGGR
jgi:GNAT superfamily N-acetyltransferase